MLKGSYFGEEVRVLHGKYKNARGTFVTGMKQDTEGKPTCKIFLLFGNHVEIPCGDFVFTDPAIQKQWMNEEDVKAWIG